MRNFKRLTILILTVFSAWYLGSLQRTSSEARPEWAKKSLAFSKVFKLTPRAETDFKSAGVTGAPLRKFTELFQEPYPHDANFDHEGVRRLNILRHLTSTPETQEEIKRFLTSVITNSDEVWIVKREALVTARKLKIPLTENEFQRWLAAVDSRTRAAASLSDEEVLRRIVIGSPHE